MESKQVANLHQKFNCTNSSDLIERIKMLRRNLLKSLMAFVPVYLIPKNTVGVVENPPEIFWTKTRKECVDGSWEESTYDQNGNQLSQKRSNGYSWNATYNQNNKQLTFSDSDGYSWDATYNQNNKQLTFSDSDGYSWESVYNQDGKQTRYSDSQGYSIEYFYQEDGTPFYCKRIDPPWPTKV